MSELGVAVAALEGSYDAAESLARHVALIDAAQADGASLLVFPENSLHGYPPEKWGAESPELIRAVYDAAEPLPGGENVDRLIHHARAKKLHVVFGIHELADRSGLVYNTSVLAGPEGLVGGYRKVHLGAMERSYWIAGDDWPVYETAIGRIGMAVCMDIMWPESMRELTLRGAELLVWSTGWDLRFDGSESFDYFTRARAAENSRWLLASNYLGSLGPGRFGGGSRIVDPGGAVAAKLDENEAGFAIGVVDVKAGIAKANAELTRQWLYWDRRPETYRALRGDLAVTAPGIRN